MKKVARTGVTKAKAIVKAEGEVLKAYRELAVYVLNNWDELGGGEKSPKWAKKNGEKVPVNPIAEMLDGIKAELSGSWADKISAYVSGLFRYRENISSEEFTKAETVTELLQYVRTCKTKPATIEEARQKEADQRAGNKVKGKVKSTAKPAKAESGTAPGVTGKQAEIADELAAIVSGVKGDKNSVRAAIYDITGELAELAEKVENMATLKAILGYQNLAEKVAKA